MRKLYGKLPTALDIQNVTAEIKVLGGREHLLSPMLQATFHLQIKSAGNQLKNISLDIENLKLLTFLNATNLRSKISNSWKKLSATLVMAESYCE